jgi:hypothetical protein
VDCTDWKGTSLLEHCGGGMEAEASKLSSELSSDEASDHDHRQLVCTSARSSNLSVAAHALYIDVGSPPTSISKT